MRGEGTNFVTDRVQLLGERLPRSSYGLGAKQSPKNSFFSET